MDNSNNNAHVKTPNITNLDAARAIKNQQAPFYDKIEITDIIKKEVSNMMQDNTKNNEQAYTKSEIDLKFQIVENKIDATADKIISKTENMFANFKTELKTDIQTVRTQILEDKLSSLTEAQKTKREFTYWFIGLLVSSIIGIVAIIVTILSTR